MTTQYSCLIIGPNKGMILGMVGTLRRDTLPMATCNNKDSQASCEEKAYSRVGHADP